jgi:hypothetical protein
MRSFEVPWFFHHGNKRRGIHPVAAYVVIYHNFWQFGSECLRLFSAQAAGVLFFYPAPRPIYGIPPTRFKDF